ncbi:plastocyanin [Chlorogloea sp. CCALA 695]|uniref:plastocyanin n=1 Tax=Chlorogloea sp. CCALA 695 TaxID=2107693 RepID=UPI000D060121|nr:plastocyanin [Chlorogloea sp. CCALA 695]PSB33537.1 plastocyanin [Chlorogloea sp. CCALA 695]
MKLIAATLRRCGLVALAMVALVSSFALFTPSAAAENYQVKLGSDKGMLVFDPAKLTIKSGDTVEWVNNKVPPHNVVFDAANNPTKSADVAKGLSHKQLLMTPGQSVKTTFSETAPGDYTYYCEPHRGAGMIGKITVAE